MANDILKSKVGPAAAVVMSKKYAAVATVATSSIGLSIDAAVAGNIPLATTALWPAAIAISAYVIAQGFAEGMAALKGTTLPGQ